MSYVEIGQRSHLSYYDVQKLIIAYNCKAASTNKLKNNKKLLNCEKLPQQNKTVIEIKMKSQMPVIVHNSISNKDDKNADLKKPMNRFNQIASLKSVYPIQSNRYIVPLSPIYLYINLICIKNE